MDVSLRRLSAYGGGLLAEALHGTLTTENGAPDNCHSLWQ